MMKIRIATVSWEGASPVFSNVAKILQDKLGDLFSDASYGGDIEQFTVVSVAVFSEVSKNEKFCKGHNKVGSYVDPFTQRKVRFISFALSFSPDKINFMNDKQYISVFCNSLLERLDSPGLKMPKFFDYNKFSEEMDSALRLILAAYS